MCFISIRLVEEGNKRIFALQDCGAGFDKSWFLSCLVMPPKVIAKLSPMADIHMTLDLLPDVTAIQVLSVKNECKELLFVLERGSKGGSPQICCVNFTSEERAGIVCVLIGGRTGSCPLPSVEKSSVIYTNRTLPS